MTNTLIQRIATVFGHPDFADDPKAYLDELNRLIGRYSEPVLEHAANQIIREHVPTQRNPWPTPGVIARACAAAAGTWGEVKTPEAPGEWSREAVAKAYDLIASPMGRQAADDGWVLSLWDHCRKHGRLPDRNEAAKLRDAAREFDAGYGEASRIKSTLGISLVRLGDIMLARRNRLADHAYGRKTPRENIDLSETSRRMTGESAE